MASEPRCPSCGYTEADAKLHMDHNLCGTVPLWEKRGAGGGLAVGSLKDDTRREPRPVDAPGPIPDTTADLHRYFCEPWCKECGRFGCPYQPEHGLKPGLHTRCPETRVEGLRYNSKAGIWQLSIQGASRLIGMIDNAHAADLLVMGVVKAVPISELSKFWYDVSRLMASHDISLPQAVAIARHRAKDQEEADG